MATQSKPIVLNGVGKAYVSSTVNGKAQVTPMGTMQDIKISFSGSTDKVYGGDGLAPIYIINKDQDITVTITEARFGLEYLNLVRGADMESEGLLIFDDGPSLIESGTSYTVSGELTTIVPEETIVTISDDADGEENATPLAYVAASPGEGEFTITANGEVTLGAEVTNKYISVSGMYTVSDTVSAAVTTASLPGFVMIRHKSMPIDLDDGKKVVIHTVIYKARSTGSLDVDYKRQEASAPELEFDVFDSGRKDGVILRMTQEIVDSASE